MCYICDSGQEDCTEDVFGDEKECEPGQGCVISVGKICVNCNFTDQGYAEKTAAGKEELRRECSRESDVEDSCEEGEIDGVVRFIKIEEENDQLFTSDHHQLPLLNQPV